jgi:excisionase family DNA binding protein
METMTTTPAANLPLEAAARVWGVSRRTAYRLAGSGSIRVARFGRRLTVPAEEVERVRLAGTGPEPVQDLSQPRRGRRKAATDRAAGPGPGGVAA